MNWLTNFIRPKIQSIVEQKDVPDDLWQKCPACDGMLFSRDVKENGHVCYHCNHHMKISVIERFDMLFDDGNYKRASLPDVPYDPLKFKDRKKYSDRLRDSRAKTGEKDGIMVAKGTIGGMKMVIAAFDFRFMGGSMGTAVGEGIVRGAELAVREKAAFMVIPASGGARMQEGMLSLMQMPRSIVAVEQVKNAGLPYIVLLTDPTTGGVSASFAMVGDIHIAEPGTTIGFAGKRVIQETIREELPEGFQTAEYLLEHGMVDMVVPRDELRETLMRILGILLNKTPKVKKGKDGEVNNKKDQSKRQGTNENNPAEKAEAASIKLKPKAKTAAKNKPKTVKVETPKSKTISADKVSEKIKNVANTSETKAPTQKKAASAKKS